MRELLSILAALAIFGLLTVIRATVMQFRCGAADGTFRFGHCLHLLLRGSTSLLYPGFGSAMHGPRRIERFPLLFVVAAFRYLDTETFLIKRASGSGAAAIG